MARYEENFKNNVTMRLLEQGIKPDLDGRIRLQPTAHEETPWVPGKVDEERHCILWLNYFFQYFQLIPWQCTGCWKIYYPIGTLEELFRIRELQREDENNAGLARKCGMDRRDNGGRRGGYVAFWYNPLFCGLDRARHNLKRIREAVGSDEVQLKRGCTEIEVWTRRKFNLGSSDWTKFVTKASLALQKELEDRIIPEPVWLYMHPDRQRATENLWIENAIACCKVSGDYSYKKFIDEKLPVDLETYGGSIHRTKDFVGGKDGRHYLINIAGRREAEEYFGTDSGRDESLLVPELEEEE